LHSSFGCQKIQPTTTLLISVPYTKNISAFTAEKFSSQNFDGRMPNKCKSHRVKKFFNMPKLLPVSRCFFAPFFPPFWYVVCWVLRGEKGKVFPPD